MEPSEFSADISLELATAAHRGTSHSPEERGKQEIRAYVGILESDLKIFVHVYGDAYAEHFERYRQGVASKFRAMLEARSRCVSAMIVGPAGLNMDRERKRYATSDKRSHELQEFRERALKAVRRDGNQDDAPIMSGDADAIPRLRARLAEAEKFQTDAKAINAAIRKANRLGYNPVTGLRALDIPYAEAVKLTTPDGLGNIGVAPYKLTNNNAEIRRMSARLLVLTRDKAIPTTEEFHTSTDIALTDAPADNRVRLKFPGKPSEEIRSNLKRNGFRWTPSLGVWQAYRTPNAIEFAKKIASGA